MSSDNHRSLTELIGEMKQELRDFLHTRTEMLRRELLEKMAALKLAAPLVVLGILLLLTAYLLFTLALVGLAVAVFPDSPYRWTLAFALVATLWSALGGAAVYVGWRKFELNGILPSRTIEVLKGDKILIQAEARNQI